MAKVAATLNNNKHGACFRVIYTLKWPPTDSPQSSTRPIRLVQCSDMHLFAEPDKKLLGLNTQQSFDAVRELIQIEQPAIDVLLVTGDIAQEPKSQTYQRFLQQIQQFDAPLFCLPGNHDLEYTYNNGISLHQLPCEVVIGNWCFILLDSSVDGEIAGSFTTSTLQYLAQALQRQQDKQVLISFHHNPIAVGCEWLDQHMLKTHEAFFNVIAPFKQVKLVLHGHVHQVFEQQRNGVTYLSCPSTSLQFQPNQKTFKLDTLAAGYRWLDLYADGQFDTQVSRIATDNFSIDYQSAGY